MKKYLVNITECVDIAANELWAVLAHEVENIPDVVVAPITPISPAFSIINTNFAVRLMADSYPENSVLMTTINAEKVRPMNVIGRTKERNIVFIGRNMGSFDWLTRDFGCAELYDLTKYNVGQFVSFAGKYVTAKVAAAAARGTPLSELGEAIDPNGIVRLNLKPGTIVHIDNFGMMKFTGDIGPVAPGDRYEVMIRDHKINAVYEPRLMSLETGDWAFFPGSSFGLWELGQARKLGARELGINVGDVISFKKI
ncbi:SAM-dependent chlorinase/fluorinase [Patescibacteria group bacterium]|nr:SAM-dependent chlorinase/fluorinase [Patescibacteria group bacterium]